MKQPKRKLQLDPSLARKPKTESAYFYTVSYVWTDTTTDKDHFGYAIIPMKKRITQDLQVHGIMQILADKQNESSELEVATMAPIAWMLLRRDEIEVE